jgi:hypothetical protein
MFRIIAAIVFIAHAIAHAGLAAAPIPSEPSSKPGLFFTSPSRSWLLSNLNLSETTTRTIGIALVALSVVGFLFAGLGALKIPLLLSAWPQIAMVSAVISLVLLVAFWHPWIVLGLILDAAILVILLIRPDLVDA